MEGSMTRNERRAAREAMRQTYRLLRGCADPANHLAQLMGAVFVPIPGRLREVLRGHALAAIAPRGAKSIAELEAEALL